MCTLDLSHQPSLSLSVCVRVRARGHTPARIPCLCHSVIRPFPCESVKRTHTNAQTHAHGYALLASKERGKHNTHHSGHRCTQHQLLPPWPLQQAPGYRSSPSPPRQAVQGTFLWPWPGTQTDRHRQAHSQTDRCT